MYGSRWRTLKLELKKPPLIFRLRIHIITNDFPPPLYLERTTSLRLPYRWRSHLLPYEKLNIHMLHRTICYIFLSHSLRSFSPPNKFLLQLDSRSLSLQTIQDLYTRPTLSFRAFLLSSTPPSFTTFFRQSGPDRQTAFFILQPLHHTSLWSEILLSFPNQLVMAQTLRSSQFLNKLRSVKKSLTPGLPEPILVVARPRIGHTRSHPRRGAEVERVVGFTILGNLIIIALI